MNFAAICGTIELPEPRMSATRAGILGATGGMPGSRRRACPSFPSTTTLFDQGARSLAPFPPMHHPCGRGSWGWASRSDVFSPRPEALEKSSDLHSRPSPRSNECSPLCRWRWASATQNNRCLIWGAPAPAAHRSDAVTAYPSVAISTRTRAIHSRPSLLATCSPKTVAGLQRAISFRPVGNRWRESSVPIWSPAVLNGWQGKLAVHTGSSSGQPASCRA